MEEHFETLKKQELIRHEGTVLTGREQEQDGWRKASFRFYGETAGSKHSMTSILLLKFEGRFAVKILVTMLGSHSGPDQHLDKFLAEFMSKHTK